MPAGEKQAALQSTRLVSFIDREEYPWNAKVFQRFARLSGLAVFLPDMPDMPACTDRSIAGLLEHARLYRLNRASLCQPDHHLETPNSCMKTAYTLITGANRYKQRTKIYPKNQ